MIEIVEKIVAAVVVSCLLCLSTVKMLGVMQQGAYKNTAFWRWLKRKNNLLFNRLAVLSLCLALATAVTALCFSFLGKEWALFCTSVPFLALLLVFGKADGKYALKVPATRTGRYLRLFGVYCLYTAILSYILISGLTFLAEWNGSQLYGLIAYVPFAVMPMTLPVLLCLANLTTRPFENGRNKKFVKRAGQVLDEAKILTVGIVGSYGKTSVKNILKSILSEKYTVVVTPHSFNTPTGIARTVFSEDFEGKEVFIAEMGARKAGDIKELCTLVKPNYGVFTGVCRQHIETFGSLDNVYKEKSEIFNCGAKKVVCGNSLRGRVGEQTDGITFACEVENLRLQGVETAFTLFLGGERVEVQTKLLGRSGAEDIAIAATLAYEMGLTVEEIQRGIAKIEPIPHRLQLIQSNGVYILDDGYNCNVVGAKAALEVLGLFEGRKCVVTPGIIECGILEEELNGELGKAIAGGNFDKVILVGDTLVSAVKDGYQTAGGDLERVCTVKTLGAAQALLGEWIQEGDCVLFLNDLPDTY